MAHKITIYAEGVSKIEVPLGQLFVNNSDKTLSILNSMPSVMFKIDITYVQKVVIAGQAVEYSTYNDLEKFAEAILDLNHSQYQKYERHK